MQHRDKVETDVRAVTHNGNFHADEVFATAVLMEVYPDMQVTRTRDPEIIEAADIVYDVGGVYDHERRRYDHHQNDDSLRRLDGLTRSSLGLIWLHYGEAYCDGDARAAKIIDNRLVRGIDARDNGELEPPADTTTPDYGMTGVIEQLNPIPDSRETHDEQFYKAVNRATGILSRLKRTVQEEVKTVDEVLKAIAQSEDSRYAVMNKQINPPEELSLIDGLEFIIFPETVDNTWRIYATPTSGDPFVSKHPFPKSWAGLSNDELARVTGVDDALFCHKKRFLAVAKTREGALGLLNLALDKSE